MIFLGVDQTGAVNSRGEPHPLPACLLHENEVVLFYLKELSRSRIESYISKDEISALEVGLDCVLGLPKQVEIPWRKAIQRTMGYDGFGRNQARDFFADLGRGQIHRREIEVLCNANSVFQEKPFQRNIQTGTFRLWKEIANNHQDFYAPLTENRTKPKAIPLFEGYPSLTWKLLFNSKTRKPQELSLLLERMKSKVRWSRFHQQQVEKDPNLADAFVLAVALKKYSRSMKDRHPNPEGWIMGADELMKERQNEQEN